MKSKILVTIFVIIFYIHFINGEDSIYNDMTSDDIPKYLTKDEVLKIKNVFYLSFFTVKTIYVLRLIVDTMRISLNSRMKMEK